MLYKIINLWYSLLNNITFDIILRLFEAILISSLVGLDREKTRRPAGLRTHVIVTLGACVVTLACVFYPQGDSDSLRISAQVLSGIGFLGAGTILRYKDNVVGLTTAASLWTSAAFGIVCGMGAHQVAIIGGIVFLITLKTVPYIERKYLKKRVEFSISLLIRNDKELSRFAALVKTKDIEIISANTDLNKKGEKVYTFTLGAKDEFQKQQFFNELYLFDVVSEFQKNNAKLTDE